MKHEGLWVTLVTIAVVAMIALPFAFGGGKVDKLLGAYRENDVDSTSVPVQSVTGTDPVAVSTSGTARAISLKNEHGTTITGISTNTGLASDSDAEVPTVKAAKTYADNAVKTNIFGLTVQDPTNGIAYYLPSPVGMDVELVEVFVKTHGMTGNVDIIQQARTSGWYTYATVQADIVADADGTAQTSFSGETTWTNTGRVGFIPTDLSAFATTNLITVDFKVQR